MGNKTAQVSRLYFVTSFGRLSQADKILSIQLRLEGAIIRPAGVTSCSVSAIQLGSRSNAGAPIKRPLELKFGSFDPAFFRDRR